MLKCFFLIEIIKPSAGPLKSSVGGIQHDTGMRVMKMGGKRMGKDSFFCAYVVQITEGMVSGAPDPIVEILEC